MMRKKGGSKHVHIQRKSINGIFFSGTDIGNPISLSVRVGLSRGKVNNYDHKTR
jgi:hypothetical protein